MNTFSIRKPLGFELRGATEFYAAFTPGSGMAAARVDRLTLAFRLDRTFEAVAVALREAGERLIVEFAGTEDQGAVRKQIARMLGLDADTKAWLDVGERDPVVGKLQREFPGFLTAAKASPYDAATWAVVAPRMNIAQAARVKIAMSRDFGDAVELLGHVHHVFPAPARLATLERVDGLSEEKVARLRGVAEAAWAGKLDADRLRGMAQDDALSELQTLRGVGPWAASHTLFRGAALIDGLPTAEPRVLHGLASASGTESVSPAAFVRAAEGWRPFRMWVCVLLARHLARAGGWRSPDLSRERDEAGKALAARTRRKIARPAAQSRAVALGRYSSIRLS